MFVSLFVLGGNEKLLSGKYNIVISIKDYGDIEVELDADAAPITVTNFVNLVKDHYYDGLTFHRIIDGFMMQGGSGKPTKNIKGEFSANGIKNNIKHERGVISMARADEYNSASSQFFIVQTDYPSLDGLYASFGHVTSGMEIVDKICKDAPKDVVNGMLEEKDRPIITSITLK